MSLLEEIQIGKKLPFDNDYKEERAVREFLDVSFDANGNEYTFGNAPDGPIIVKMECEEAPDYQNRRKVTPTRNYVSSILQKYNASVFRNEPTRQATSPTLEQLFKNADGYGNNINAVMRKALLQSQKFEASYLLADSTATDTEILTIAQKNASGAMPYIRSIEPDCVVNYEEIEDKLVEAIILLEDEQGVPFARYMNDSDFMDIEFDPKNMRVTSVGAPYAHGYSDIPLVEVEPFDSAQALPVAHSQRTIVNTLSLLQQEMNDAVFSKFILSGVRLPQQDDTQPTNKVNWSGKRMVVLEDAGAKLDLLGADKGCAESLRDQISVEETAMFRAAGLNNPNVEPTNMSGYALKINMDSFFSICSQLKHAIEAAENKLLELICGKEGIEFAPTVYSDRFVADDNNEGLLNLRDQLALSLPATLKRLLVRNYISTYYNVNEADMALIENEMMTMYGATAPDAVNIQ